MHERNMLWKAHDFLAYARQSLTTQTRIRHPDAGTGPGPLKFLEKHPPQPTNPASSPDPR